MVIANVVKRGKELLERMESSPTTVRVAELDSWHSSVFHALEDVFGKSSVQEERLRARRKRLSDEYGDNPRMYDEISWLTTYLRETLLLMDSFSAYELAPSQQSDAPAQPSNHVTITLGDGAVFTGPIAVGQTISQAFNAATDTNAKDTRQALEELVVQVGHLVESLDSEEIKRDVAEQLAVLVDQAKKPVPSRRLLEVTGEGLIEAAKTVAKMAAPVAEAVKTVLKIVLPT